MTADLNTLCRACAAIAGSICEFQEDLDEFAAAIFWF